MPNNKLSAAATRRKFLAGATVAGAAVVAPSVVKAQGPIAMRWQSTWPSKDIFHEYALDYAKKVNDMSGGDLKIEVLPAGAVVPAFGLIDAVSKGTLDGGHGVLVYHYGKQNALALWGSGPGYAMDANMLLAWHKYGGGKELLAKLYASIGMNVVSFPYGPMYTQPLGWYKKPITGPDDFKGIKFRTVGLSIDVFQGMGAAVNALPGGEIVSAMDRGLIEAAEFNNASSDRTTRLCRRVQGVHAAELPPECRAAGNHLQQDEIRFAARQVEGDHRQCESGRFAGHAVEIDRPLFAGLHRAANEGQSQSSTRRRIRCSRRSSKFTTRSRPKNRRKTRCSRKSSHRRSSSPSGRPTGSRTPS